MRAVLITGAGRRIGAAVAADLGRQGWLVFVHYNRSRTDAELVAAAIRHAGGAAETVAADLANLKEGEALIDRCARRAAAQGVSFSALINNASLFDYDALATMTEASWQKHSDVNLRAPVFLTREFARHVPSQEVGCVINILDNKVFAINPDYFSYTISKVGLQGATRAMAMALAPRVRVCGIAPGIVLPSGRQTLDEFARAHRNNPLGRGASLSEITGAVRFILATESLNGDTITIDGGQSLCRAPRDVAFLSGP